MFCLGLSQDACKKLADQPYSPVEERWSGTTKSCILSIKDFTQDLFALTLLPKPLDHREVAR